MLLEFSNKYINVNSIINKDPKLLTLFVLSVIVLIYQPVGLIIGNAVRFFSFGCKVKILPRNILPLQLHVLNPVRDIHGAILQVVGNVSNLPVYVVDVQGVGQLPYGVVYHGKVEGRAEIEPVLVGLLHENSPDLLLVDLPNILRNKMAIVIPVPMRPERGEDVPFYALELLAPPAAPIVAVGALVVCFPVEGVVAVLEFLDGVEPLAQHPVGGKGFPVEQHGAASPSLNMVDNQVEVLPLGV